MSEGPEAKRPRLQNLEGAGDQVSCYIDCSLFKLSIPQFFSQIHMNYQKLMMMMLKTYWKNYLIFKNKLTK